LHEGRAAANHSAGVRVSALLRRNLPLAIQIAKIAWHADGACGAAGGG